MTFIASDIFWLLCATFAAGAFTHLVGGSLLKVEVAKVVRHHTGAKEKGIVSVAQMAIARRFHMSPFAFLLSWIPFALIVSAQIVCSLIRDAGYRIFPWAILITSILFGPGWSTASYLRRRRLRKLLFPDT